MPPSLNSGAFSGLEVLVLLPDFEDAEVGAVVDEGLAGRQEDLVGELVERSVSSECLVHHYHIEQVVAVHVHEGGEDAAVVEVAHIVHVDGRTELFEEAQNDGDLVGTVLEAAEAVEELVVERALTGLAQSIVNCGGALDGGLGGLDLRYGHVRLHLYGPYSE
jgi:hypothetical protein